MEKHIAVMPESLLNGEIEKQIYSFIIENWPTTPIEIATQFCEELTNRENKRRASTKYAYYVKKLVEKKLILSKKAGNSIIVWPLVVEKYRAIHHILKHQEQQTETPAKTTKNIKIQNETHNTKEIEQMHKEFEKKVVKNNA